MRVFSLCIILIVAIAEGLRNFVCTWVILIKRLFLPTRIFHLTLNQLLVVEDQWIQSLNLLICLVASKLPLVTLVVH